MMDIKEDLHLWFTNFLIKSSQVSGVNTHANKSAFNNERLAEELHKPIIKKLRKDLFIQDLETIFGVLIWLICNK